jgi:RNA polymerase sigma factor (TIGR02999 family)
VPVLHSTATTGGRLSDLEQLIRRADQEDASAAHELFAVLYGELHRLAEHILRRDGNVLTLGATTLLHEAYLRMAGPDGAAFPDRGRFFAYASRAMRTLVIDYSRRQRAAKRGRQFEITLSAEGAQNAGDALSILELEGLRTALEELAALEPRLAEIVDLHFFGGFSFAEIAEMRQVSERTVGRDWRKARLLLQRTLLEEDDGKR